MPDIPEKRIITEEDIRKADASYVSFPAFDSWKKLIVDDERWSHIVHSLDSIEDKSSERLERAFEMVRRAAAVDTGAIEGLYKSDRGLTFTVAAQAAMWLENLSKRAENAHALFESQLATYEMVLDFATGNQPITEAWIRLLHEEICSPQKTYSVITAVEEQEQALPKGEYKKYPNHVITVDGSIHSYAPVDSTSQEMSRLLRELSTSEFENANPALQAAYCHHAFTAIHPFADGNGRVARALASVFTYRSVSVPILILVEHRDAYFECLARADSGVYQSFVDFIVSRVADAMFLVVTALRASTHQAPRAVLEDVESLYTTRSGYTHLEVDEAGIRVLSALQQLIANEIAESQSPKKVIALSTLMTRYNYSTKVPEMRTIAQGNSPAVMLDAMTTPPAGGNHRYMIVIDIPKDVHKNEQLLIRVLETGDVLPLELGDVMPSETATLHMGLRLFAQQVVASIMTKAREHAQRVLQEQGFRPNKA